MNGAANRRKGHRYELDVAHYMDAHGFPGARTSRSALGHGGTRQPGDVIGPEGVDWPFSLECKNVIGSAWPSWLAQATRQGAGRVPVVVRKGVGVGDVGAHPTVLPLAAYLDVFDGVPPIVGRESRTCQADVWLSRLDHQRVAWHDGRRSWAIVTFAEFCRAAR